MRASAGQGAGKQVADHGKAAALVQTERQDGAEWRVVQPGSVVGWPRSSPRLMACPIDPPFVHNVWSLDFKYARYAKKLGDCAGTYGSAAPRWVSSGSVNSEPKPVRLGPGADHRLPPIVVYNNINLKWNLGSFCQKCVWRRPIDPSNINGLCHIPPLKV